MEKRLVGITKVSWEASGHRVTWYEPIRGICQALTAGPHIANQRDRGAYVITLESGQITELRPVTVADLKEH